MQIAAADKSLGTDPTRAEHWPVPRRQAWFAFVMAFLLMVFDYMDRQVVVSMFPALKAEWGLSDKQLGALTAAVSITVAVFAFPIALLANDFVFYWGHRLSHTSRWFWANHVSHHSSQHYNLTTALRQPWTSLIAGVYLLSLPVIWLGVPPALYFFAGGINLTYQFWIHTEAVDRLGPLEWVLNTPSHHRVHHATNPRYLDANYAGILIIWDRLFGTFVAEEPADPPRYGLVKNVRTFNPLWIAFHEYVSIARDVGRARSLSHVRHYVFGRPGWSPDGSRKTTTDIQAEWRRRTQARPQLEPAAARASQSSIHAPGHAPGGIAVAAPQPTAPAP